MKKNIALVTGGYSKESVISYKSASNIFDNIDTEQYNCYIIDINKNGWYYTNENKLQKEVNKNDFSIEINNENVKFDLVFICIHGTPGEDGKIQGYLDCLHIPYTSSSSINSAIMCNKHYTKAIASQNGINIAKSLKLYKNNNNLIESKENIISKLKMPLFIKPNNGGSSIGTNKVTNTDEIIKFLEIAFEEDNEVLVEEFIDGREFTVGVFNLKGDILVFPITEIISENGFFDFVAKYEGQSNEITPAVIDKIVSNKLINTSKKIYKTFHCKGLIRIDYIYNDTMNEPFMLEINSIPGQTKHSIVPKQLAAMGWSLKTFYSMLIEEFLLNDRLSE
jgi:D-alanine-D-alanine ligase